MKEIIEKIAHTVGGFFVYWLIGAIVYGSVAFLANQISSYRDSRAEIAPTQTVVSKEVSEVCFVTGRTNKKCFEIPFILSEDLKEATLFYKDGRCEVLILDSNLPPFGKRRMCFQTIPQ